MSVGKNVEKWKFYGNVIWSHFGKIWELNIELPYDPKLPFLCVYLRELKSYVHT